MLKSLALLASLFVSVHANANCEISPNLLNKTCSPEFFKPKNKKQLNEYLQYGKFKNGNLLGLEIDFDLKDKEINIPTSCHLKLKRGASLRSSLNGICVKGSVVELNGENKLISDKKAPIIISSETSIILRRSFLETKGEILITSKLFKPFDSEVLISRDSFLRADKINISTPSNLIINKESSIKSSQIVLNGGNCEVGENDDREHDDDRDHGRACKKFAPKISYTGRCASNPIPASIKISSNGNTQDSLTVSFDLRGRPVNTEVSWRFDNENVNTGLDISKRFLFPGRHLVESVVSDQNGYFRKIGIYQNLSPNKFNKGQVAIFQFSGLKRAPYKVTALMGLSKFTLSKSEENPELYFGEIPNDVAGTKLIAIPELGYVGKFNLVVLPSINNPDTYINQNIDQLMLLLDSGNLANQSYINAKASLRTLLEEFRNKFSALPETDKQKVAEYLQANIFSDFQGVTSFHQVKEKPLTLFGLLVASTYAQDIQTDIISTSASDMKKIAAITSTLLGAGWAAWFALEGLSKLTGAWRIGAVTVAAIGITMLIMRIVNAQDTIKGTHTIDSNKLHLKIPIQIKSDEVSTFSVWGQAVPLDSIGPTSPLISQSVNAKNTVNFEMNRINSQLDSFNSTLSLLGFSSQIEPLPLLSFPQTSFPTVLSTKYITNVQLISSEDGKASIKNYSKIGNNLQITFHSLKTQRAKLRVTFVNADLGINKNIDTDIIIKGREVYVGKYQPIDEGSARIVNHLEPGEIVSNLIDFDLMTLGMDSETKSNLRFRLLIEPSENEDETAGAEFIKASLSNGMNLNLWPGNGIFPSDSLLDFELNLSSVNPKIFLDLQNNGSEYEVPIYTTVVPEIKKQICYSALSGMPAGTKLRVVFMNSDQGNLAGRNFSVFTEVPVGTCKDIYLAYNTGYFFELFVQVANPEAVGYLGNWSQEQYDNTGNGWVYNYKVFDSMPVNLSAKLVDLTDCPDCNPPIPEKDRIYKIDLIWQNLSPHSILVY